MNAALEDLELAEHVPSERALGEHAANRELDDFSGGAGSSSYTNKDDVRRDSASRCHTQ